MKWQTLIKKISFITQGGEDNPNVCDITYDSRKVKKGSIFVAIPGFKVKGDDYITAAITNGAVGVVSENMQQNCCVPWIQVRNSRESLSLLAGILWGIDFSTLQSIGITGTNGKTTVTGLYQQLMANVHNPETTWMFSTIVNKLGSVEQSASHTTPEAADIFQFIGNAEVKPKVIVMEVSSHALALYRLAGFFFDLVVWTNFTQDHLDFHKDMNDYYQAKKKLFTSHCKQDSIAVINIDDPYGQKLAREIPDITQVTYGLSANADVRITNPHCSWGGTEIDIRYQNQKLHFKSLLVGYFNIFNMAALIAGGLKKGIAPDIIQKSLYQVRVPGRMERLELPCDFSVVIDYAHTPDALKKVLFTARKLTSGRLLCVFGCGGDRDKAKRPQMAQAVAQVCDQAIITSDNPRTEPPLDIINDIIEGMPLDFPHLVIADRKEAISKAFTIAASDDCVVIAGKGHENYQEIQGTQYPFDDKQVAIEILRDKECRSGNQDQ